MKTIEELRTEVRGMSSVEVIQHMDDQIDQLEDALADMEDALPDMPERLRASFRSMLRVCIEAREAVARRILEDN